MTQAITATSMHGPGVRWLVRDGEKVLQQEWEIREFTGSAMSLIYVRREWRDIETVVDGEFPHDVGKVEKQPK